MASLKDKVQYALDEARLLILGAQVLLGLQYRAVFETGFEKLPVRSQYLNLAGLCLLLIALALLVWPGAYHRLVERGEDTDELHQFTNRILEIALLPFAVALSINLFVAAEKTAGTAAGLIAGATSGVAALAFWYGFEAVERFKRALRPRSSEPMKREDNEKERGAKLKDKIEHVLTEIRVVLPGAQALLGFQCITILTDGFEKLPLSSKYVHLASLGLIAASIILLMTPAAYHRIVEKGEESERFFWLTGRFLLAAMVALAPGVCGDFFVVIRKVTESTWFAVVVSSALLLLFYGLWFGLTIYWRNTALAQSSDGA